MKPVNKTRCLNIPNFFILFKICTTSFWCKNCILMKFCMGCWWSKISLYVTLNFPQVGLTFVEVLTCTQVIDILDILCYISQVISRIASEAWWNHLARAYRQCWQPQLYTWDMSSPSQTIQRCSLHKTHAAINTCQSLTQNFVYIIFFLL